MSTADRELFLTPADRRLRVMRLAVNESIEIDAGEADAYRRAAQVACRRVHIDVIDRFAVLTRVA